MPRRPAGQVLVKLFLKKIQLNEFIGPDGHVKNDWKDSVNDAED